MKSIHNRFGFVAIGLVASLVVGGASAADAPAVEWKVSDGGNGHWYKIINKLDCWEIDKAECEAVGGYLATLTSQSEEDFIPWPADRFINVGGKQEPGSCEPGCGWGWITGEQWNYTRWSPGQPENGYGYGSEVGIQDYLVRHVGGWHDGSKCPPYTGDGYVVEWSADCNDDGVVDYGQIKSGELADTNNNGVPDVCELMITSVKPVSGASTGGTAVRINGNNFPISPIVTFGDLTATDIVRVSPSLITAVTPAGTPGMAVVAVNGASSESFYYRPSCGSDLDNSGVVDSGDLSIVLLDFGSCSDSLTTAQEQEPMIFQTTQTPVLNKK
jgi:hypothetical protein